MQNPEDMKVAELRAEINSMWQSRTGDLPMPGLSKKRKAELVEILTGLRANTPVTVEDLIDPEPPFVYPGDKAAETALQSGTAVEVTVPSMVRFKLGEQIEGTVTGKVDSIISRTSGGPIVAVKHNQGFKSHPRVTLHGIKDVAVL